ncbi:hypothetical protein Nepgr_020968 [Nepenthes gracilis]|uniref:Uncharacterized protein n=1 Tax=Nepenthes gracilis TaxID=150966 RepID=A0AAD3SYY4_NEPGR|nr:hypothetical protein Nepgr_020968 [Nepenthes gracilis]
MIGKNINPKQRDSIYAKHLITGIIATHEALASPTIQQTMPKEPRLSATWRRRMFGGKLHRLPIQPGHFLCRPDRAFCNEVGPSVMKKQWELASQLSAAFRFCSITKVAGPNCSTHAMSGRGGEYGGLAAVQKAVRRKPSDSFWEAQSASSFGPF